LQLIIKVRKRVNQVDLRRGFRREKQELDVSVKVDVS